MRLRRDGGDGLFRNLVLYIKDIGQISVIAFGPDGVLLLRIDQLDRNADALTHLAHAAFKDVFDSKPLCDLGSPDHLVAKAEAGVAGNHAQLVKARQPVDDVFGDTVCEIPKRRVIRHGDEGQNRNAGLAAGRVRRID